MVFLILVFNTSFSLFLGILEGLFRVFWYSTTPLADPEKRTIPSFLHMFSKFQHLNLVIAGNVIGVEISPSDVNCYNSSFVVNMANFGTLKELCTARKEECPQILLH